YFRLKAFEIVIPPLRERTEDIPLLADYFLGLFRQQGRKVLRLSPQAMDYLLRYDWPGNVRQFRNAMESALFRAGYRKHMQVEVEDLPTELRQEQEQYGDPLTKEARPVNLNLDEALARIRTQRFANINF